MIAGVDGCKDEWIAAVDLGDGRTEIRPPVAFRELFGDRELDLIVIDVPIGLVEKGPRQADVKAREFLRERGCCVFTSPIRPILDCRSWEEACRIRCEVEKKKISKQQFGILSKVREVDGVLRRIGTTNVFEGHPEVSFALMNGGAPILIGKKKREGKERRSKLISEYFSDADERIAEYPHHREDVLDAYALLWTARRIKRGEQRRFPETPELDRFGLRTEIAG
jgi:predicted RNase H-like nuclease